MDWPKTPYTVSNMVFCVELSPNKSASKIDTFFNIDSIIWYFYKTAVQIASGKLRVVVFRSVTLALLCLSPAAIFAQEASSNDNPSVFDGTPVEVVNEIATRISKKQEQRAVINESAKKNGGLTPEQTLEITDINSDIERLKQSLLLSVGGRTAMSESFDAPEDETTWQEDVVDILKPLADSVKDLTKRPREIAELREQMDRINNRTNGINQVIEQFQTLDNAPLSNVAKDYVNGLFAEWQDELEELEGEELIVSRQLEELVEGSEKPIESFLPKLKKFFLGTGLTLILAVLVALCMYLLMRAGWWLYSKKIVSKDVRRKSTIFRLFSYSYHLLTGIVVILSILFVIYFRDDLLLLALAALLLAGLLFNLKQVLPRYLAEARLLLNLGSVREEERVVYNGLPWQVKSINLNSVLHNPALDGIARLPLSAMQGMVSRPVKNKLWFPTQRGDYVILPDGLLGQIKFQTPDLVEVIVRGGMSQTYTTADFYALNVTNLSREETFGVSTVFGLDYSLQKISVSEIPNTLKAAVDAKLKVNGYEDKLANLISELSAANTSSLDYLIFATFDKSVAGHFYKLERLMLQACVEVSNEKDWVIPFNQLTVHNQ